MNKVVDYLKLYSLKKGPSIFTRNQFDRLFSLLLKLARIYRRVFISKTKIVVISGSLGKTTATRAITKALNALDKHKIYSNYGSSLAYNLMHIRPWEKYGVLEAGISRPGMMNANVYLTKPDVVVITAIKQEHSRSFKDLKAIRQEKVKLVKGLSAAGWAILNGDDENVRWMATQTEANVLTYGLKPDNDIYASHIQYDWPNGMRFEVTSKSETYKVNTQLFGEHFVYSVLSAITVAIALEEDIPQVIQRLKDLTPTKSRFEPIQTNNNMVLIDDAYKAGIDSVRSALKTFGHIKAQRKVILMGDIEDPPASERGDVYREMGVGISKNCDIAILLGGHDLRKTKGAAIREGMHKENIFFLKNGVNAAIDFVRGKIGPGDVILVKGRGTQRFQRIVLALKNVKVSCPVEICTVKVQFCDECPLLDKKIEDFDNQFILPYIKK